MTNKKEKMKKKTQKEREFDKWWEEWELTTGHSPTKIATYSWHTQKIRQREAEVRELLEDTLIDMDMSAEDTAYLDLAKDRINKFLSKLKPTQDENRNKAK